MFRKVLVPLSAAALALPLTAAGGGTALASPSNPILVRPHVCSDGGPVNDYHMSEKGRYIGNRNTRTYGASGGVLSISRGKTVTVTGSLTTTATAEAGVIFAQASASVGVSVGLSKAVTTTVGYTWAVPKTQPEGWVEMGSHGYTVDWTFGHYVSPCTWYVTRRGQVVGATSNVQFAHS